MMSRRGRAVCLQALIILGSAAWYRDGKSAVTWCSRQVLIGPAENITTTLLRDTRLIPTGYRGAQKKGELKSRQTAGSHGNETSR
uniref:Putative secreted protein n=1 Tax=Ixodes ricinus TaxID=34613 RepID=A0A6B0TY27_IXORI